jgi:molybdate transport system substrate-binding protein
MMTNALSLDRQSSISVLLIAVATLLACPSPARAQIKVIISGGFSTAYQQVLPEFERSTGITVTTLSGSSQGKGPETIVAQLSRGVSADVAILSREGLTELIAAGRIAAGTDVDLARAALGVAIRSGARKPDISTVEAFKQALVSARVVAVPASTSGIYLTTDLFPRLGIADKLSMKIMPRGSQSAALVASGDAAIVVQPISELLHAPGLDFVGPIPAELQLIQTFAAAIVAGSKEPEASRRLIAFLASDRAAAAIKDNGMEPIARQALRIKSLAEKKVAEVPAGPLFWRIETLER